MARMSPGLEADVSALAAVAVLAGLAWVAGSAVLGPAPAAERLGAGILCLAATAWLVMLQPLAGVSVTGSPWTVRFAVVAAAGLAIWRLRSRSIGRLDPRPLAATLSAGLLVSAPAWLAPGDDYPARATDVLWHEGWIRQLAGGGRAPGGIYADVPNAYPWLEHALAALVLSAGGLSMTATLIAVEALMLLALGTGTWLLAIELDLGTGAAAWAAVLALAGGGLGWLQAAGPAAVLTATRADPATTPADLLRFQRGIGAFGGDLLLSPAPTPALGNIPPAMPRELGLALVPLAAWAGVRASRRASPAVVGGGGRRGGPGVPGLARGRHRGGGRPRGGCAGRSPSGRVAGAGGVRGRDTRVARPAGVARGRPRRLREHHQGDAGRADPRPGPLGAGRPARAGAWPASC